MPTDPIPHWIGGEWRAEGDPAPLIDPASGAETGTYRQGNSSLTSEAIGHARRTFDAPGWAAKPRLRSEVLLAFADELAKRKDQLIDRIVLESGKLRSEATHEVMAGISESRYYAGLARAIFGRVQEIDEGWTSVYAREA
ncbi:MAG: aldehyde dehydrogenase family protein, partial [Rhodospirillaceae bacterium]|nr:aldehyde dehydrogenase family protein [Rhodospirillaceae bacterium]